MGLEDPCPLYPYFQKDLSPGFWKGKKVLVTGAHGFTGSQLCRELAGEGADVTAYVKAGGNLEDLQDLKDLIKVRPGDVTDVESLLKELDGMEYVFHPAAIVPVMDARKSPQKSFLVNGIGTFNVGSACMKTGVKKMLHISTCHVYGNQPESELPIKESAQPLPCDIYAASKYSAEIFLRPLIDEGASIVISRAFAKYGPGQGSQYLIPRIITQLLQGQTPKLGSPRPSRDYSYIKDIVHGYMLVLEKGNPGEIYHLSSERETTVGEIYDIINQCLEVDVKPVWNDQTRPQDILRLFGDSSKARTALGWRPEIPLKEGLMKTISWWKIRLKNHLK